MIPKNKAELPADWFHAPSTWRLSKDGMRAMDRQYPGVAKSWPIHRVIDLYHLSLLSKVIDFPYYIANGKELVLFDENEYLTLVLYDSIEDWLDNKAT